MNLKCYSQIQIANLLNKISTHLLLPTQIRTEIGNQEESVKYYFIERIA